MTLKTETGYFSQKIQYLLPIRITNVIKDPTEKIVLPDCIGNPNSNTLYIDLKHKLLPLSYNRPDSWIVLLLSSRVFLRAGHGQTDVSYRLDLDAGAGGVHLQSIVERFQLLVCWVYFHVVLRDGRWFCRVSWDSWLCLDYLKFLCAFVTGDHFYLRYFLSFFN